MADIPEISSFGVSGPVLEDQPVTLTTITITTTSLSSITIVCTLQCSKCTFELAINSSSSVETTSSHSHATQAANIRATTGVDIHATNTSPGSKLVLTGVTADVNSALLGVKYVNLYGYSGSDEVILSVRDISQPSCMYTLHSDC